LLSFIILTCSILYAINDDDDDDELFTLLNYTTLVLQQGSNFLAYRETL